MHIYLEDKMSIAKQSKQQTYAGIHPWRPILLTTQKAPRPSRRDDAHNDHRISTRIRKILYPPLSETLVLRASPFVPGLKEFTIYHRCFEECSPNPQGVPQQI